MRNHLYSLLVFFTSIFFFYGSSSIKDIQKTVTTYEKIERTPRSVDTTFTYYMPSVQPTAETQQKQTKGGVDVSCEILPFTANRTEKEYKIAVLGDQTKPNYDVFEVHKVPQITVTPEEIWFKIRVRNKQERVLKLIDVPIVMIIDGVQFSIADDNLLEWKNALVVQNFEKEYVLKGPKLNTLQNAKAIYISINDIPTKYDQAGTVQKKENFEWFFGCSLIPTTKTEKIQYEYKEQLAESEQCKACNGVGRLQVDCSYCKGEGKVKVAQLDGTSTMQECGVCKGAKKVWDYCRNCDKGVVYHRKSRLPSPDTRTMWTGWNVQVNTIPAGLNICTVTPETGKYDYCRAANPGGSNGIAYYRTGGGKTYYLRTEYNGKEYFFEPYDDKGKRTQKVTIDFTQSTPLIKGGKMK